MYSAIAKNKRNTVFIIIFFLGLIGGLSYLASVYFGDPSIVALGMLFALGYAGLQYATADKQALAFTGAVQLKSASDYPRLWRIVENLAITEGLPMPKVYVIDDPAPNAFATGRDPKHASVAATRGLLELLDDDELEGVMAHELGHVKNYDIRVSMIVFGLVIAIGFIADFALRASFFGRNGNSNNPVIAVVAIVAFIIAPIAGALVQMAVSRQREYLADASGALTTRHPEALARALGKLGAAGRPMKRQNASMAHLWIADPIKPGAIDKLFSTHPPITDRIKRLQEMGGRF